MPTVTLRAAFSSDPFASSPSYSDLSARFLGGAVRSGRQDSLGQFEPGTATFTLDNRDRALDPFHTSGTYGSNVRPGKRVNLRATWSATTYDVYTGYIRRVHPVWPSVADAFVEIECVDAFGIFARKDLLRTDYASSILALTPRAYYRMGEPVGDTVMIDSSGNARHGTYNGTGGKSSAPGGLVIDTDTAMDAENSTKSATGATLAGMTGGTGVQGVELLFRPYTGPPLTDLWALFDQVIGGGGERFLLTQTDGGKVRLNYAASVITSATNVIDGWNHVIATFDGSQLTLRVNGVWETPVLTAPFSVIQNAPHIAELYDGTKKLDGAVDEVVIYSGTVPTQAQSLEHYEESLGAWGGQRTDQRITRLLDQIDWPAGDRDFSANGVYYVSPLTQALGDQSFLEHMQDVIRTEYGLLFINGAGQVSFRPEMPGSAPGSSATFGEGSGEIHYSQGPDAEYSEDGIFNEVLLESVSHPKVIDSDATSETEYGPRTFNQSGLMFASAADMTTRAARILADRKDPKKRIKSVRVRAQDDSANSIPVILGTELGDTVTAKRVPVGGGSAISIVSLVDGISHTIGPDTWVTDFALSPW